MGFIHLHPKQQFFGQKTNMSRTHHLWEQRSRAVGVIYLHFLDRCRSRCNGGFHLLRVVHWHQLITRTKRDSRGQGVGSVAQISVRREPHMRCAWPLCLCGTTCRLDLAWFDQNAPNCNHRRSIGDWTIFQNCCTSLREIYRTSLSAASVITSSFYDWNVSIRFRLQVLSYISR
jgi:hypothetical protein